MAALEIVSEPDEASELASRQHDAEIIEHILCECAQFYSQPEKWRTLQAFDRERGQFLLLDEGWEGYRHIHRLWAHVELRDGKFWIQEDGTQDGSVFENVADAQRQLEAWRVVYNEVRPHQSLRGLTPQEYQQQWRPQPSPTQED